MPCPTPGDPPNLEIEPMSLAFPALADEFFTTMPPGKPSQGFDQYIYIYIYIYIFIYIYIYIYSSFILIYIIDQYIIFMTNFVSEFRFYLTYKIDGKLK